MVDVPGVLQQMTREAFRREPIESTRQLRHDVCSPDLESTRERKLRCFSIVYTQNRHSEYLAPIRQVVRVVLRGHRDEPSAGEVENEFRLVLEQAARLVVEETTLDEMAVRRRNLDQLEIDDRTLAHHAIDRGEERRAAFLPAGFHWTQSTETVSNERQSTHLSKLTTRRTSLSLTRLRRHGPPERIHFIIRRDAIREVVDGEDEGEGVTEERDPNLEGGERGCVEAGEEPSDGGEGFGVMHIYRADERGAHVSLFTTCQTRVQTLFDHAGARLQDDEPGSETSE